jgi:hypothetical protein
MLPLNRMPKRAREPVAVEMTYEQVAVRPSSDDFLCDLVILLAADHEDGPRRDGSSQLIQRVHTRTVGQAEIEQDGANRIRRRSVETVGECLDPFDDVWPALRRAEQVSNYLRIESVPPPRGGRHAFRAACSTAASLAYSTTATRATLVQYSTGPMTLTA